MIVKQYQNVIIDGVIFGKLKQSKDNKILSFKGQFLPSHYITFKNTYLEHLYKYEAMQYYAKREKYLLLKSIDKMLCSTQKLLTYTPYIEKEVVKEEKKFHDFSILDMIGASFKAYNNKYYEVVKVSFSSLKITLQLLPTGKAIKINFQDFNTFYKG